MTFPTWTVKLAAAAVIPVILGVGVAVSAPSMPAALEVDVSESMDLAAVTGPTTSEVGKARPCGDPSWPIVPFSCREAAKAGDPLRN